MWHKRPPEETNADQKAALEGEVSQSSDYYNLIPERAPEHLHLTGDKNSLGVGAQKVKR